MRGITGIVLLMCVAEAYAGVQISQMRPKVPTSSAGGILSRPQYQVRAVSDVKPSAKEQEQLRIQKKWSGKIPGVTGYVAPRPGVPPPGFEGNPPWNPFKGATPPAVVRTIDDQPELNVKDNWFKKWLREGAEPHHPIEGRRNVFAPPFEDPIRPAVLPKYLPTPGGGIPGQAKALPAPAAAASSSDSDLIPDRPSAKEWIAAWKTTSLAETSSNIASMSVAVLVGFLVGSGITFAVFRVRRSIRTSSEEWLMMSA